MASALIADRTRGVEQLVAEKNAAGWSSASCPRATAVAAVLVDKLRGWENLADVPLEELVTPATLEVWRGLFDDPILRAGAVASLRGFHPAMPWVEPQDDGSVAVLFAWIHPEDENEDSVQVGGEVWACKVRCRLVENPDDWRVERIG